MLINPPKRHTCLKYQHLQDLHVDSNAKSVQAPLLQSFRNQLKVERPTWNWRNFWHGLNLHSLIHMKRYDQFYYIPNRYSSCAHLFCGCPESMCNVLWSIMCLQVIRVISHCYFLRWVFYHLPLDLFEDPVWFYIITCRGSLSLFFPCHSKYLACFVLLVLYSSHLPLSILFHTWFFFPLPFALKSMTHDLKNNATKHNHIPSQEEATTLPESYPLKHHGQHIAEPGSPGSCDLFCWKDWIGGP